LYGVMAVGFHPIPGLFRNQRRRHNPVERHDRQTARADCPLGWGCRRHPCRAVRPHPPAAGVGAGRGPQRPRQRGV
jgi:hypothetical protein